MYRCAYRYMLFPIFMYRKFFFKKLTINILSHVGSSTESTANASLLFSYLIQIYDRNGFLINTLLRF